MTPTRVMIVEDNTTVAKDLRGCLIDLGYEVTSIQVSGEEAVENAGLENPDIIMMDIHLRDKMTGLTAAELIFNQFKIPIVFLSAYSDNKLLEKAKQVGAFGYLVKPFEERELFASIEMAIYKAKSENKQRKLEAHLAQMQKLEGFRLMAGSIAHNFNNILQVPLGLNELLLDELPAGSPNRELVETSISHLERAANISRLMIQFVGHGKGVKQEVNLTDQLPRTAEKFRNTLPEQHTLREELTNDSAIILGDSKQIQEMTQSLLINATEAIGNAPGEIVISSRIVPNTEPSLEATFSHFEFAHENYLNINVRDTGCGMDEVTKEKIFDPFFTTKFTGRGLGMASALGIIQGHDGSIEVESRPGEGSVIKLIIPIIDEKSLSRPNETQK